VKHKFHNKIVAILSSSKMFRTLLVLFVIETSWIAISGLYPMAYDENTHLGIIKLYTHRWLPFWSSQPSGANIFGAVNRDPSYMYHYLLSFPFRVFEHFIGAETAQVLFLRLFSIVFFVIGLLIYRKLLTALNAPKTIAHVVLLIFILTPIVPFLAAQINYDNLLFPISGLAFLYSVKMIHDYKRQGTVDVKNILVLVCWCLFGSLVMFSFLPIMMSCVGLVIWLLFKVFRQKGFANLAHNLRLSYYKISRSLKVILVILVVLLAGLFAERYGLNMIRYGNPVPSCDKVLNIEACKEYSPWLRDYQSHQDNIRGLIKPVASDPFSYTVRDWIRIITVQFFFVLNGPQSAFEVGEPLLLPMVMAIGLGVVGIILAIRYYRYLQEFSDLRFLALAGLFYTLVLWQRQYFAFLNNGYAVAIQSRYLIAFMPIFYLIVALAYQRFLNPKPWLKSLLVLIFIGVLLLQGGGAMVFILRSDPAWYWPNNYVITANRIVQKIMQIFVLGS
jgi:hypothetical protein